MYRELLNRYGHPAATNDHTIYIHVQSPESLTRPRDVAHRDEMAAKDIQKLERYISQLKDYRQALAVRYAELETMPFHYRLKLRRYVCYNHRKEYYLTIDKILSDGSVVNEIREVYPGKEWHKALARFEEIKKQRPGIIAEKDIEKGRWEK